MYSPSRINLLSDQEIEAIYAVPNFNKVERELYFSLTDEEMTWSTKCTHLVRQFFSFHSIAFQTDSDSDTQDKNAIDGCCKTLQYNSTHLAALHNALGNVSIAPALV